MNPITPQSIHDHAELRRRELLTDIAAERARATRRAPRGAARRVRPARIVAAATFVAAALLGGVLVVADAVTATPPAATQPAPPAGAATSTPPDCAVEAVSATKPVHVQPRTHRQRDRLAARPV